MTDIPSAPEEPAATLPDVPGQQPPISMADALKENAVASETSTPVPEPAYDPSMPEPPALAMGPESTTSESVATPTATSNPSMPPEQAIDTLSQSNTPNEATSTTTAPTEVANAFGSPTSAPVESSAAPTPLTPPTPTPPVPATTPEKPPVDPFDAVDGGFPQAPSPTSQTPTTNPLPQPADPLMSKPVEMNIAPPPPGSSFQPDAAIFQDPMYDTSGVSAGEPGVPEGANLERGKKRVMMLVIVGVVVALILAIGGFVAFKFLQ
jgi:hypothetical protein